MQSESAPLPAGKTCLDCMHVWMCQKDGKSDGPQQTYCTFSRRNGFTPHEKEEEEWEREERLDPAPDEHGNTCYDCANFFVCRSKGGSLTPCENPALGFQADKPSPYTLLRFRV